MSGVAEQLFDSLITYLGSQGYDVSFHFPPRPVNFASSSHVDDDSDELIEINSIPASLQQTSSDKPTISAMLRDAAAKSSGPVNLSLSDAQLISRVDVSPPSAPALPVPSAPVMMKGFVDMDLQFRKSPIFKNGLKVNVDDTVQEALQSIVQFADIIPEEPDKDRPMSRIILSSEKTREEIEYDAVEIDFKVPGYYARMLMLPTDFERQMANLVFQRLFDSNLPYKPTDKSFQVSKGALDQFMNEWAGTFGNPTTSPYYFLMPIFDKTSLQYNEWANFETSTFRKSKPIDWAETTKNPKAAYPRYYESLF